MDSEIVEGHGVYVHIPFCLSRCTYCGFYSSTFLFMQDDYVDALLRELTLRKNYLTSPVRTIYIGGGTPSTLSGYNLSRIVQTLETTSPVNPQPSSLEEFTIECNPDDISRSDSEILEVIAKSKINRVSMGAQTFSEDRLSFLHRRHKTDDVQKAVENLRKIGVENISIDLMFGFPNETIDDWTSDIDKALQLDVPHISAYSLMYEEETPLYCLREQGKIREIDEETSLKMYEILIDKLIANGYEHYEISNFAHPGMQSKHNSSYWHAVPYIGIGAAAHSYDGHSRQWNIADIHKYIEGVGNTHISSEVYDIEYLDEATRYNDLVTTGMRIKEGININKMCSVYNLPESFRNYFLETSRKLLEQGLLVRDGDNVHLSQQGLFISDYIMSDLVFVS